MWPVWPLQRMKRYSTWLYTAAFLLLAIWLVWLWYGKQPTAPQNWSPAKPAHQVGVMPKVDHAPPPKIKVLPKQQASKKLGLPAEVADDPDTEIIDTAEVPPAPDGATTVTTINMQTGEARTIVKANPRPLFAFMRTGAAGIRYGISSNGGQQAALFVRQDVLRVGNVYLAGTAEARTEPIKGTSEAYGALEVSYRW